MATCVEATVKGFVEALFARFGLNWQDHIKVDQKYIQPREVGTLIGDPLKAANKLNWNAKTHWKDLAGLMVDADVAALKK